MSIVQMHAETMGGIGSRPPSDFRLPANANYRRYGVIVPRLMTIRRPMPAEERAVHVDDKKEDEWEEEEEEMEEEDDEELMMIATTSTGGIFMPRRMAMRRPTSVGERIVRIDDREEEEEEEEQMMIATTSDAAGSHAPHKLHLALVHRQVGFIDIVIDELFGCSSRRRSSPRSVRIRRPAIVIAISR